MIFKSALATSTAAHLIRRHAVRYNSTKAWPIGPFCTQVGHRMTSLSYAGAVTSTTQSEDNAGGGTSSTAKLSRTKQSSDAATHFENALKHEHQQRQVAKEELPVSYPPENYPPIIISLWLDDALQGHFSSLRAKYFPISKNYLQGHITLFHALPSEHLDFLMKTITSTCAHTKAFEVFCEPYTLSKNAAVFIPLKANQLISVRKNLLGAFKRDFHMTDQDVNPNYWPHATVVNKVKKEEAEKIFEEVRSIPQEPHMTHGRAKGLDVWFYRGGPWEHIHRIPFDESSR